MPIPAKGHRHAIIDYARNHNGCTYLTARCMEFPYALIRPGALPFQNNARLYPAVSSTEGPDPELKG
jgi:hypothetical protein